MPARLLKATSLFASCDPLIFPFETTATATGLSDSFGQSRAHEALAFAMSMDRSGYNVYVLGDPGTGRHTVVRHTLESRARAEATPPDLVYLHSFTDPERPRSLSLPAGRGLAFRQTMQKFVQDLATATLAAFESEEFRSRIESLQSEFKGREDGALTELGKAAVSEGVVLMRTPQGFVFAPLRGEEALDADEFAKLPEEERERLGHSMQKFGQELEKLLHQFPRWRKELQEKIRQASREAITLAVGHLIEDLKAEYQDLPEIGAFLDEVMQDVIDLSEALRDRDSGQGPFQGGGLTLERYQVNLLVSHAGKQGAPVVYEDNPSYQNLIGRVDTMAQFGMQMTNFTLIRAGSLHRANGGYLVLDAHKILSAPFAWEGLKRALKSAQIQIESTTQLYGLSGSVSLEPQPVPLQIKVILIGDRQIYYLLRNLDPEFADLFKVEADFEDQLEKSDQNIRLYGELITTLVSTHSLLPVHRRAAARIVEESGRRAADQSRLSAGTRWIADLLCESDHHARQEKRSVVDAVDIDAALLMRARRADRLKLRIHEAILRESLLIETSGSVVGQINGLAVVDPGESAFAYPVRITATVRMGDGHVVDIERETEMGGPIHSKGVLILTAYLANEFAQEAPLCLSASLVFEQSYGAVEGDSASLAELCVLLSAIARVPLRQDLALTGSVNQRGQAQAIGGVNEKIEGFYDICKKRTLNGTQGVIIPAANEKHLMLRPSVRESVEKGEFHIYSVEHVDQAIELLTGLPARGSGSEWTENIRSLTASRLDNYSRLRQAYANAKSSS
ncbi:MAG: AAA family ATPase [Spirochaetales bacterium]|nr:AAA family ATPase [Spirochaetales bacterium]